MGWFKGCMPWGWLQARVRWRLGVKELCGGLLQAVVVVWRRSLKWMLEL